MKILNKKLFLILLISLAVVTVATPALAQGVKLTESFLINSAENSGLKSAGTTNGPTVPQIIGQLINAAFGLLGVLFLVYTLTGGLLWMIAGGNEEKVTRAVKFIVGGIEGLIVIFMAYALVYVVLAGLDAATSS